MTFEEMLARIAIPHFNNVPHMDFGGAVGNFAQNIGGAYLPGAQQLLGGQAPSLQNVFGGGLGGLTKGLTAQSNFNTGIPDITQTNFAPGMATGALNYGNANNQITNSIGNLNNQANLINNSALQVGGQAGSINGLANNLVGGPNSIYGQQQSLADALSAQAAGQGPNPAQDQFKQNINNNLSQQASAISSVKGLNPALAARMVAEQGANTNQQAAGQEATLGAQQQLAAQSALGQQLGAMGNTVLGAGNLYGGAGSLYNQQGALQNAAGNSFDQAGNLGGSQLSGANNFYSTNVSGQGNQNSAINQGVLGSAGINAGVDSGNTASINKMNQGLLQGVGAAAGLKSSASNATSEAHGGMAGEGTRATPRIDHKAMALAHALMAMGGEVPGEAPEHGDSPKNDIIPTVLSPGEGVLPRSIMQAPDAPARAAAFVEQLKSKAHPSYGRVLLAKRKLQEAMTAHHACMGGAA